MNFWYEVIEKNGSHSLYMSHITERYDSKRQKHIFSHQEDEDADEKEIFTFDPVTEEIEWNENANEILKEDDEVQSAIRDFKNATFIAHGDNEKAKEWLEKRINQFVNIGFNNEIVVSVNGKNIGADRMFWLVKRIYSCMGDGEPAGEPVIVTRTMDDPETDFYEYLESGEEHDLYINDEGHFKNDEIFKSLWDDIVEEEKEIYDISFEYRPRVDFSRYFDFD